MSRELFKSLVLCLLIFGGIALFLFGDKVFKNLRFGNEEIHIKSKRANSGTKSSGLKAGQVLDSYRGVKVYYNGSIKNVVGRNTSPDGYNLGLKYQCVEFAKRFYYQVYNHRMPDSYGHAKDFFNPGLADGENNKARSMTQFKNHSLDKPRKNDLVVSGPTKHNAFGHLFIITEVGSDYIEFIQQNPGVGKPSRDQLDLVYKNKKWIIDSPEILGWLRI